WPLSGDRLAVMLIVSTLVCGCNLGFDTQPVGADTVLADADIEADTDTADSAEDIDANDDVPAAECDGACPGSQCCPASDGAHACTDLTSDTMNCGGCGFACGLGLECVQADCRCPAGSAECDDDPATVCETPVLDDPLNCGDCGVICSQDSTCAGGNCVCNTAGFVHCVDPIPECVEGTQLDQCG